MSKKNRSQKIPAAPVPDSSAFPWSSVVVGVTAAWAYVLFLAFYKKQPFPLGYIFDLLLPDDLTALPPVSLMFSYLVGILWALSLLLTALLMGRLILSRTKLVWRTSLESMVFSAGLGYGVLAYLTLGLGAVGFLYKPVFRWGVLGLTLMAILWFSRPEERSLFSTAFKEKKKLFFSSGRSFFLFVLIFFISLTLIIMSFVPELFYDALVYHLGVPNFYLHEHRIAAMPMLTSKFPFTIQMLYVIGLALKDEAVTNLTHGLFLFLIFGALGAFGIRQSRPRWGLLAGVLFASIPTVWFNAMASGVDVGVTLFGLLAGYALIVSFEEAESETKWRRVSAVFAGLALGSKYTAAPIVAALGLAMIIVFIRRQKPITEIIKESIFFGVIALIVFAPWPIKNYLETGNPVYPFLGTIFRSSAMEPWRYLILKNENNGMPLHSIKDVLLSLWNLSVAERSSLSFQGPLLLAAVPLLLLVVKQQGRPAALSIVGWISLFFFPIAFLMTRLTRYWMPGLPIVCLLVGYALLTAFEDKRMWMRLTSYVLVASGFLLQATWVFIFIHNCYGPRQVLLGRESRNDFLSRFHDGMNPNPSMSMYVWMKEHLSPTDRVLMLGEEKGYPIDVRHIYAGVYDVNPIVPIVEESNSAAAVAERLRKSGFTHLLVNVYELPRLSPYGSLGFSEKGYPIFVEFWRDYVQFVQVQYGTLNTQYKNPIVLAAIRSDKRPDSQPPNENFYDPSYKKYLSNRHDMLEELQKVGAH